MPQIRCFAPSIRPDIEPVVSSTKTISRVGLVLFIETGSITGVETGSMTGFREGNTKTLARQTPAMKVISAIEIRMAIEFIGNLLWLSVSGKFCIRRSFREIVPVSVPYVDRKGP